MSLQRELIKKSTEAVPQRAVAQPTLVKISTEDRGPGRPPAHSWYLRSRWQGVLAGLAFLLLAFEAIYLFAANVFLHTSYFQSVVNGNADKILVTTKSAYSFFPGWVEASEIQVRGQDASTQWLITLENARVTLSLRDLLLHHHLHFRSVNAKQGRFDLRSRSLPGKYTQQEVLELPPIFGFDLDSLLKSRSNSEKRQNELNDLKEEREPAHHSGLSEIAIDQVEISKLTELWINAYRFNGGINLKGSFTLNPGQRLEIPGAKLKIISGSLLRQDRDIAQNLTGSIDASIHDYLLGRQQNEILFRKMSGTVSLQGRLDSLDPFSFVLKNQDWFRLQKTEGNFSIDAVIQEGRVVSIHKAVLVARHLIASFSHFIVEGAAKIAFAIDRSGMGRFEFSLPSCQIISEKDRAPILDGSHLRILVQSPDLELDHLYSRVIAQVILPHSKIANFQFLNRWIPQSSHLTVESGSGQVDADLTVSNYLTAGAIPGKVSIVTDGLKIKNGSTVIAGKVTIQAGVEQVFHGTMGQKELKILNTEIQVTGMPDKALKPWTTDMKISEGSLKPDDFPVLRAKIGLHIPDVSPFLAEFGIQDGLGKVAQNMLLKGNFEGSTQVTLSDNWFDLDEMKLNSDGARMLGLIHLRGDMKQALAVIHYGILSAGIELENDKTHLRIAATDSWYQENSEKYASGPATPVSKY